MADHYIVDRRGDRGKQSPNRERLLRRIDKSVKDAIPDIMDGNSIDKIGKDGKGITVPIKGLDEPNLHHDHTLGRRHRIYSGNDQFRPGDKIPKPLGGSGSGSGEGDASDKNEGEDDFIVNLSRDEFIDFFFKDLELPFMEEKREKESVDSYRWRHAGVVQDGIPARLNVIRSMGNSLGRRIALQSQYKRRIEEAEARLALAETEEERTEILAELELLRKRLKQVPYLDDVDLRYDHFVKEPIPIDSAVMFCLMDVSGSMTQSEKDIAKRFFFFLYLFLESQYKQVEIVWIKHNVEAKRCDEDAFFNDREGGGTVVSSALELADEIKRRGDKQSPAGYQTNLWNIYFAQASDGDNFSHDNAHCQEMLATILKYTNYFAYTQIRTPNENNLWKVYEEVAQKHPRLVMRHINDKKEIWKVFQGLFQKQEKK